MLTKDFWEIHAWENSGAKANFVSISFLSLPLKRESLPGWDLHSLGVPQAPVSVYTTIRLFSYFMLSSVVKDLLISEDIERENFANKFACHQKMFVKQNYQALKFSRETHSAGVQFIVQSAASSENQNVVIELWWLQKRFPSTENAVQATRIVPNAILSERRDGRILLAVYWGI